MSRPLEAPGEPLEIGYRAPDGTDKTIELVATKTLDEAGLPILVVNVRDTSDRRESLEALQRSEERHRRLLDSMPDQILRFDREGRYLGAGRDDFAGLAVQRPCRDWPDIRRSGSPRSRANLRRTRSKRRSRPRSTVEIAYSNGRPDGLHHFEIAGCAAWTTTKCIAHPPRRHGRATTPTPELSRLVQILDATPDVVCSFDFERPDRLRQRRLPSARPHER